MGRGILNLLSIAALAALPQGRANVQEAPLASGIIKSIELGGTPDTSVRHFRLDRGATALPADAAPLGLLRWISGPDPSGDGLRLELEATFFRENVLVVHSERLRRDELVLTWREVRDAGGRTLVLRGSRGGGFTISDSSAEGVERRSVPGSAGEFPLALLEAARRGQRLPAEVAVFDPSSGAFEPVTLVARTPPRSAERVLELVRADGSLRTRARFQGGEWSEWCWQEGGLVARSIEPEDYAHWLAEHQAQRHAEAEAEARDASALRQAPRQGRCSSRSLPVVGG